MRPDAEDPRSLRQTFRSSRFHSVPQKNTHTHRAGVCREPGEPPHKKLVERFFSVSTKFLVATSDRLETGKQKLVQVWCEVDVPVPPSLECRENDGILIVCRRLLHGQKLQNGNNQLTENPNPATVVLIGCLELDRAWLTVGFLSVFVRRWGGRTNPFVFCFLFLWGGEMQTAARRPRRRP